MEFAKKMKKMQEKARVALRKIQKEMNVRVQDSGL